MEKTLDKALDLLTALALKLGTTVEHLWPVLIRQAFFEGMVQLGVGLSVGTVLALAAREFYRRAEALWAQKEDRYDNRMDRIIPMRLGMIICGVLALIILPLFVSVGFLKLMTPEFYALRFILEAIGGK